MDRKTQSKVSSETINQRAIALADMGWLDEAVKEFSKAIELDQAAAYPRINRASVLMEQGRSLEALEDLITAVKLAPENPTTHLHLGIFLTKFASDLGVDQLHSALNLDSNQLEALLQLGSTHASKGNWTEAKQVLDSAFEMAPDDPVVNRECGTFALDQGRVHDAIFFFKNALKKEPEDPDIAMDLGLAYVHAGFPQKGTNLLLALLERFPDHLYALYNLAAIKAKTGDQQSASEYLRRAMRLDEIKVKEWLKDDPVLKDFTKRSNTERKKVNNSSIE